VIVTSSLTRQRNRGDPYAVALAISHPPQRGSAMAWTTPILIEICIGLEINGYLPAEF
jgi:coenzyme PQQ precursor peptide PqqA